MGETERLSRRHVLKAGVALASGSYVTAPTETDQEREEIVGWVMDSDAAAVDDEVGTIEERRDSSLTLCTGGELYAGQFCTEVEFDVFVDWGRPQPSVGDSYRFVPTGSENVCGDVEVQLVEAPQCSELSSSDETPTSTTETTTTETTTTTEDDSTPTGRSLADRLFGGYS